MALGDESMQFALQAPAQAPGQHLAGSQLIAEGSSTDQHQGLILQELRRGGQQIVQVHGLHLSARHFPGRLRFGFTT